MIVVAIVGVLAAIAIPTFLTYARRSKTSEATNNLSAIYRHAAVYYNLERIVQQGLTSTHAANCVVTTTATSVPAIPGAMAQYAFFGGNPSFADIHYVRREAVFFGYAVNSSLGTCDCPASSSLFTLAAHGNLDDDSNLSTFEISVGSNSNADVYHSPGFYIVDEIE